MSVLTNRASGYVLTWHVDRALFMMVYRSDQATDKLSRLLLCEPPTLFVSCAEDTMG